MFRRLPMPALLIPAVTAFALAAVPAATQARPLPQTSASAPDPVADLLRQKAVDPAMEASSTDNAALEAQGEAYHRAPDVEQNPAELAETDALNASVAARNAQADQIDAANQAAAASTEDAYSARMAAYEAEVARINVDNAAREEAAAVDRDRYAKEMADWRATVAACNRGDTVRCRAGSMPARPGA